MLLQAPTQPATQPTAAAAVQLAARTAGAPQPRALVVGVVPVHSRVALPTPATRRLPNLQPEVLALAAAGDTAGVQAAMTQGGPAGAVAATLATDEHGRTALHLAATHGRVAAATLLLYSHGLQPNTRDKEGKTALHLAAEGSHIVLFDQLVAAQGDPQIPDQSGRTAADIVAALKAANAGPLAARPDSFQAAPTPAAGAAVPAASFAFAPVGESSTGPASQMSSDISEA